MSEAAEKSMRRRIVVVAVFAVLGAAGLGVRAWDLQVRSAERLAELARRQHTAKVTLKARRGMIFDREGKELAISLPVESVFAQPRLIEDKHAVSRELSRILGLDARELEKRLKTPGRSFVWIDRQVSEEKIARIRALDVRGIGFIEESKRYYPKGELAAHVLGFAGVDSVGLEGIEYVYDEYLRGSPEELVGARDARGRAILARGMGSVDRLQGDHLTLTIDSRIQHIAESELAAAIKETGSKAGSIAIMDPKSGEVLAIAVHPSFDPNHFSRFDSRQFRNRVVTDVFEPGSTLKPFLLAAAYETGVVAPNDIFYCENGELEVWDRTFHDHKPYGWLSAENILRVSSNIGSIKIGERVGGERYYEFLRAFGFGRKTGIDLAGEADGLLRTPGSWSGVSPATLSFGQGLGVTPVQLLTGFSALANGGVLVKPTVLREVRGAEGHLIHRTLPEFIDRVISERTARKVTDALIRVVDEGTGVNAQVPGYSVAGKTGTAQKADPALGGYPKELRVVSFAGFAPARDARVVALVVLDEPDGRATGGGAAAPVFARVAARTLAYLEVPPDRPLAPEEPESDPIGEFLDTVAWEPTSEPAEERRFRLASTGETQTRPHAMQLARAHTGTGVLPDLVGRPLREVLRWQGASRVQLRWEGHGVVIRQDPPPGTPIEPGMPITLELRPPG